jgi:S-adenosylmethionine/arginine decarboxylase-like enzyme
MQSEDKELEKYYGKEVVLDLHNCNPKKFTRELIEGYFKSICGLIDMQRADLHWWDDEGLPEEEKETDPHLKGTSAIQFITTSNITIHTLDILKNVYINVFSCKDFESRLVESFTKKWFEGEVVNFKEIIRK